MQTTKAGFCHHSATAKMTDMRSERGCFAQVLENNGGSHE
jgi:hypothetical protein